MTSSPDPAPTGDATDVHGASEATDPRVARSRARVVEAATTLLVEHGPRAVTVDAVSERSGVAKSTMYRHWPSRTALLVDVIRANMPPLPDLEPGLDFEAALRSHVAALAAMFDDPHWRRIMPSLFLLKQQIEEVDALADHDHEERVSAFHHVLQLGVDEGRLPADLDLDHVACTVFGPLVFAVLTGSADERAVADLVVDQLLAAYRVPT